MFSFFQRLIKKQAKPDISLYGDCKSYVVYSSTYPLSNGLILSIGRYDSDDKDKKNQTEAVLFDPRTNTRIAETALPESYRPVSNLFNDNKLLLRDERNNNIAVLNCETLKVIDNVVGKFDNYADWYSIGDQRFVTFDRPNYHSMNAPFRLLVQDLAAKKFNQPASLPLPINEEEAVCMGDRGCISVDHFSQLANGQFACLVRGHNTGYFAVILFDKTPGAENEFKVAGVIKPQKEAWGMDDNSTPFVNYVGLPNGDILTYHYSGQNFQVWHGTECIDTWSWHKDVKCNDKVFNQGFWTFQVTPLPDGENLLINSRVKLFMFNMKTHEIQPVDLGKFKPEDVCVSQDGKAIVRAQEERDPYETNNMLLTVDFNKILAKKMANNPVATPDQTSLKTSCRM